jgi:hypothetical protein
MCGGPQTSRDFDRSIDGSSPLEGSDGQRLIHIVNDTKEKGNRRSKRCALTPPVCVEGVKGCVVARRAKKIAYESDVGDEFSSECEDLIVLDSVRMRCVSAGESAWALSRAARKSFRRFLEISFVSLTRYDPFTRDRRWKSGWRRLPDAHGDRGGANEIDEQIIPRYGRTLTERRQPKSFCPAMTIIRSKQIRMDWPQTPAHV